MSNRFHWLRIGCLLLLAGAVQLWNVLHNQIPAQDAVAFVQIARQFDHSPCAETLRRNPQHPLFPALIWASHHWFGGLMGDGPGTWVRCAQWVAASAAVFMVLPMYFAGVRLANPLLSSGATALFIMLPYTARLGADALSDSTYLLLLFTGFWASTEFLATRRIVWLVVAGLAVGCGYLARLEALLLAPALALTAGVMQIRAVWRMPWRSVIAAASCFTCGLAALAAPYIVVTGKLSPKGSLVLLPGGHWLARGSVADDRGVHTAQLSDGQVITTRLDAALVNDSGEELDWSLKHRVASQRPSGFGPALHELTRELVEGMHYLFGLLVLLGIARSAREPANLLAAGLGLVFVVVLLMFASRSGYVASRHVLPLVALGSYVASRGGWILAGGLGSLSVRFLEAAAVLKNSSATSPGEPGWGACEAMRRQGWLAFSILLVAGMFCLPRSLSTLHTSRVAHAEAGRWLAQRATTRAIVLDSRGWAALVAGLPAYSYHGARIAVEDPRLAYVIVERTELDDGGARGATLRFLLSRAGEKLAEFRAPGPAGDSVLVYGWKPERVGQLRASKNRATHAN